MISNSPMYPVQFNLIQLYKWESANGATHMVRIVWWRECELAVQKFLWGIECETPPPAVGSLPSSCPRARARDRVGPLAVIPVGCCCKQLDFCTTSLDLPCCCMHLRNLITTFEEGRIITCRRPRFSALEIVLRQSASTDIRTI